MLDALVGSCATKLQEIITEEVKLIVGVEEELKEIQQRTDLIQCSLSDAEARRMEEPAVEKWLGQLRDVMYDIDDIVDLARYKGRILPDHPLSSSSKSTACSSLSLFCCLSNLHTRHEVAHKIKSLNRKLEKISNDKVFVTFKSTPPTGKSSGSTLKKSSNIVEPNLVGKEVTRACRKIVGLVLQQKEKKVYKVAIVGTAGVGKTTLAQKIFNDKKIKECFNTRAWVCVSKEYSDTSLLRGVLRIMQIQHEREESVGELQNKLESAIKEKTFFLVLDDMWQSEAWTNLLRIPLHAAATGIILATTRHDTIAREIGADHIHRVDLMSDNMGWELLLRSLYIDEEKQVQNLRNIGIEIVRRCGGLPLAIKVIASVLATKERTENGWKRVINKSAWSMDRLPTNLRGALFLSFDELPGYLKQCFLYCALFPENSMVHRDDLVRLWIAEGFVEEREEQLLEDTAEEYYSELIYRNLLQPDPSHIDHGCYKMHNLLRQLALHLSGDEIFCGTPLSLEAKTLSKLRRVSITTEMDSAVFPVVDKEQVRTRTLIFCCDKSVRVENTVLKRFPCIRVLDLSDTLIQSIPSCIGHLIHLRLLDLDRTDISSLPESIGSLQNLQILNLQGCKALHSLPSAITQLCNLRRLGLDYTPINEVPKGIGQLKFLNDLEGFPIGGTSSNTTTQDGWHLEELGSLSQLRHLRMIKLQRAAPSSSRDFLLTDKKHLKVLDLRCTEQTDEDVSNIEKIFEKLNPPRTLEELIIVGFFGESFPHWLGTAHLSSLKYLKLINCKSCTHLPPIWQLPNLKYLRIEGATAITKIGHMFVGCGVGNLEVLIIEHMHNWEEWSLVEEGEGEEEEAAGTPPPIVEHMHNLKEVEEDRSEIIMKQKGEADPPPRSLQQQQLLLPCLKELTLECCPKLTALPRQLGEEATSLKVLIIKGASCLKTVENFWFLSEVLSIIQCESLERVSNFPLVRELHVHQCSSLRCVEQLGSLERLCVDAPSQWVFGLQDQHRQLCRDKSEVYIRNLQQEAPAS